MFGLSIAANSRWHMLDLRSLSLGATIELPCACMDKRVLADHMKSNNGRGKWLVEIARLVVLSLVIIAVILVYRVMNPPSPSSESVVAELVFQLQQKTNSLQTRIAVGNLLKEREWHLVLPAMLTLLREPFIKTDDAALRMWGGGDFKDYGKSLSVDGQIKVIARQVWNHQIHSTAVFSNKVAVGRLMASLLTDTNHVANRGEILEALCTFWSSTAEIPVAKHFESSLTDPGLARLAAGVLLTHRPERYLPKMQDAVLNTNISEAVRTEIADELLRVLYRNPYKGRPISRDHLALVFKVLRDCQGENAEVANRLMWTIEQAIGITFRPDSANPRYKDKYGRLNSDYYATTLANAKQWWATNQTDSLNGPTSAPKLLPK